EVDISEHQVRIRDYGRGIPLGKVVDVVSKINTGGKYDSSAFQKAVGLNGVGTKAVNALSKYFKVQAYREGKSKAAEFERGILTADLKETETKEKNGTTVIFEPDDTVFKHYRFIPQFLEEQIWNYAYLNSNLTIVFNGQKYNSPNGLLDLLSRKIDQDNRKYPIIHLKGEDIELALTHGDQYGEEYYSFVNGQYTTQGGTHLQAFRESYAMAIRDFFSRSKDNFELSDIRASVVGAISVRVQEPIFESQTKTKLGSMAIAPEGQSMKSFVSDFIKKNLDDYLHSHKDVAQTLKNKIQQSKREREELAGIKKVANERAKKASLHNKKLRDCRIHFTDKKNERNEETTLFLTEGDSASGSITKARNVQTQAVFSLRGKPLNCFGLTKKIVYENEEFNLLQHALDIEDGLESLRYNNVVIATDADVDGMHIRLLILTFFLQFFPDLVKKGHLYILETPLFRVRNKKETKYCYTDEERRKAIQKLGPKPEITRFKGLGEISPDEFGQFIGEDIRLEPVILNQETSIQKILSYYMGKNTPDRQLFIIENLKVEKDLEEILL
ncbi:MAG: type IIA DNA topoisomerase subunit B, partial [Verrucomicrobia bacterium]|nr:type IIA DNA topoisomerase subunit B [Cytophagales bacterium]